jgi:hypothetical protein
MEAMTFMFTKQKRIQAIVSCPLLKPNLQVIPPKLTITLLRHWKNKVLVINKLSWEANDCKYTPTVVVPLTEGVLVLRPKSKRRPHHTMVASGNVNRRITYRGSIWGWKCSEEKACDTILDSSSYFHLTLFFGVVEKNRELIMPLLPLTCIPLPSSSA